MASCTSSSVSTPSLANLGVVDDMFGLSPAFSCSPCQVSQNATDRFLVLQIILTLTAARFHVVDGDRFQSQAFWGRRGDDGVGLYSKHVEGFHRRSNKGAHKPGTVVLRNVKPTGSDSSQALQHGQPEILGGTGCPFKNSCAAESAISTK
jgi:hypothetical protein